VMFDDKWVQLYHFIVVVKHGNRNLARDLRRERGDVGEEGAFRHGWMGLVFLLAVDQGPWKGIFSFLTDSKGLIVDGIQ